MKTWHLIFGMWCLWAKPWRCQRPNRLICTSRCSKYMRFPVMYFVLLCGFFMGWLSHIAWVISIVYVQAISPVTDCACIKLMWIYEYCRWDGSKPRYPEQLMLSWNVITLSSWARCYNVILSFKKLPSFMSITMETNDPLGTSSWKTKSAMYACSLFGNPKLRRVLRPMPFILFVECNLTCADCLYGRRLWLSPVIRNSKTSPTTACKVVGSTFLAMTCDHGCRPCT